MLRMLANMAIPPLLEIRIANIENKQAVQERLLNKVSNDLVDFGSKQSVQSAVLDQHTSQNLALLRDQRQVITAVSAIEAIIKTGGILTAVIKWVATIVIALVSIYAAVKGVQSGDLSTFLHIK